jgi:hypothetical protein
MSSGGHPLTGDGATPGRSEVKTRYFPSGVRALAAIEDAMPGELGAAPALPGDSRSARRDGVVDGEKRASGRSRKRLAQQP